MRRKKQTQNKTNTSPGVDTGFFLLGRIQEWDAQTMHLLSFAISVRNEAVTHKKSLKGSVRKRQLEGIERRHQIRPE